jgi:hypothetical protein
MSTSRIQITAQHSEVISHATRRYATTATSTLFVHRAASVNVLQ